MIQKKIHHWFLSVALCGVALFPGVANARSVAETVERAVNSNPDVYAAYAAQHGKEGSVKEKRSDFFPVFGADASFEAMRVNDDNTRGATGGEADNGYGGEGSVRVSQMIYDGRNVLNSYKAAQNRFEASKYEVVNKATGVALSSVGLHLNVLRMRELEYTTSRYLKDLETYEVRIKNMVDEGASNEAELLQAREVRAIAHNALLNYRERTQFVEAEYLQVVGVWPDNNMTISEEDVAAGESVPASFEGALEKVREQHPMLRSGGFTVDALGFEIEAEEARKLPRVDAELSHFMRDQKESFGGEREDTSALLRMSWNFETGGAQKARILQRRQDREEARLRLKSVERELEKKLRQTMARYNLSLERLKLQDKRRKTNASILKNYQDQFEGGNRSLLELVNVRNQAYQANVEYSNAYYGYYLAQFELLNAAGMLQDALGIKVYEVAQQ